MKSLKNIKKKLAKKKRMRINLRKTKPKKGEI
jgi:hypothetical protein